MALERSVRAAVRAQNRKVLTVLLGVVALLMTLAVLTALLKR